MTSTGRYGEERLGELLGLLPPAPPGWVEAAQELPAARREFDEIIGRAEADAAFRAALLDDLEAALAGAGYEPAAGLVRALRGHFVSG
jgi:hypothetical protein